MLLAFACHKNFILYQMDVKSAFLKGFINEEVYVEQPPGFGSFNFHNHVFKLKKALYGLKQAPRAWYERLSKFLISSGFKMGKIDTTLFIKLRENDILIVQIYVDDIIFCATNVSLCEEFAKSMHSEFEMSMMGELMSLKVIYFQFIFLIDFYIKRPIYMQESGINFTKLLCGWKFKRKQKLQ